LFNSGSTGFAADSGAVRAVAVAAALGRMVAVGTTVLGGLGTRIGVGSTPAAPEDLGKGTAQEAVDIGIAEGVGRRRVLAVVEVGTVVAAAGTVVAAAGTAAVVGRHCSRSAVVGVESTAKGVVVVPVDCWRCSRWRVDLALADYRTGHPWPAHKFQARNSHYRQHRSKVVFGTGSHSVCCCTDNCCSRDVLGSNHRTVDLDTGTAVGTVVGKAVGMVVGTVVDMGVDMVVDKGGVDTGDRMAEGSRCCLLGNKACDSSQLGKGTCVPGTNSRPYQSETLLLLSHPLLLPLLLLLSLTFVPQTGCTWSPTIVPPCCYIERYLYSTGTV